MDELKADWPQQVVDLVLKHDSFGEYMSVLSIGIGLLALLVVALIWFLIYYFGNPVIEQPDGVARIEGSCGDTMEIGLKIIDGRVVDTHYWTNGCSHSKNCVQTAATLARNKSIEEVRKINMISIMDITGTLPDTHLHCAQLAETTLQKSLDNYDENLKEKSR